MGSHTHPPTTQAGKLRPMSVPLLPNACMLVPWREQILASIILMEFCHHSLRLAHIRHFLDDFKIMVENFGSYG